MSIFEPITETEIYNLLAEEAPKMSIQESQGIVSELRGIGPQRKRFFRYAVQGWLEEKEEEKKKAGK